MWSGDCNYSIRLITLATSCLFILSPMQKKGEREIWYVNKLCFKHGNGGWVQSHYAIRKIHLSGEALDRRTAQSAHCLMVLINGLASSGVFAHYRVLFMLSWVMMPTQQLLPQPFRWSERGMVIIKRRKTKQEEGKTIIREGNKALLCRGEKCHDLKKVTSDKNDFHSPKVTS